MPITFACGSCGKSFTVDDKFAGKKGKCKQCGAVMQIPEGVASRASAAPRNVEVSPSRRPPAPASPSVDDLYGLDEPLPSASKQSLPPGVEEVESDSPLPQRLQTRPSGAYAPPKKKKKKSSGGGGGDSVALVVRIALGVILGFGALGGVGYVLRSMAGVSSRGELEAVLKERVDLNQQLATVLSRVNDVPSARTASPQANQKIRGIAANLRKLKVAKGLKTDLEALKQKYLGLQEQASQQVIQQILRIGEIEGAREALDIEASLKELDIEEKSIGVPQAQVPQMPNNFPARPQPPPNANPASQPDINPGPGPAPNTNRPRPGNRRNPNRPGAPG